MQKDITTQLDINTEAYSKYAQIISIVTSKYDATFLFYQIEPKRVGEEGHKYNASQKEVARITVPIEAANELTQSLIQLFSKNNK